MRATVCFVIALSSAAACFHPSYDHPACSPVGECPDGLTCVDGACVSTIADAATLDCIGTSNSLVKVCPKDLPLGPVTITGDTLQTDSSPFCSELSTDKLCIVVGTTVSVGVLSAEGTRALVIAATQNIDIIALSVASFVLAPSDVVRGAGSQLAMCTSGDGATSDVGPGGGAGGSFGTVGGAGGKAFTAGDIAAAEPAVSGTPTSLRGGCDGGAAGGTVVAECLPGAPGGGAVFIVADGSITVTKQINASGGASSAGDTPRCAGPGAGSGGFIGLDSPLISVVDTQLFANGGGGAEGNGNNNQGAPGLESFSAQSVPKGGAGAASGGGDGGDGAYGITSAGAGAASLTSAAGGGGGGGGAGMIRVWRATTLDGASVSPPALFL